MNYIDFYSKKANLHREMVDAIIELMKEHNVSFVNLLDTDASHAFVLLSIDGADDVTEVEVNEVFLKDNSVFITTFYEGHEDEDYDIGLGKDVVTCSIADIFESLYEHLVYGK